ncbi:DUF692 domain-containing protein [Streptomyces dysideae]|uniref:DUF692 domain-containing protein n=1 Tax=Streptomyces dysideae TaxID=909626 RepID=UPI000833A94D
MERLGTGIGWRPEIADAVERMPGIDWVETVAENVCPGHLPESLVRLRERGVTVIPHGVSLGLGGAERPDAGRLAALAERVTALGAPLVTEHIAFVRAGGPLTASPLLEAGHLLPVPRTRDALDVLCENVRIAQDTLPVPLAVENIAALISWPGEEMTEGQFLYELADRTGVRLLIDVANLHTNHVNRAEDPAKALAELPLEAIAYVHVAGGFERAGVWHDSHAHPVPEPVLTILADLASRVSPPGVLLERDENFPEQGELVRELGAIREALEKGAAQGVAGRSAAGGSSMQDVPERDAARGSTETDAAPDSAERDAAQGEVEQDAMRDATEMGPQAPTRAAWQTTTTDESQGPRPSAPLSPDHAPGDPTSRDDAPGDSTHTAPAPVTPTATAPTPSNPKPVTPTPAGATRSNLPSTEPTPGNATATAPAPSDPEPVAPTPGNPTATAPAPVAPGATTPTPSNATATAPAPSDPEPVAPTPGNPTPSTPTATTPTTTTPTSAAPSRSTPEPTASTSSTGPARQRLALSQAALLSALVAGTPVPEGFDRVRLGVQARALAGKRADVVAKVAPELPGILGQGYRAAFLAYAQRNPMTGGYRRDALDFAEYLLAGGRPEDADARRELREWWLERSGPAPRSQRAGVRLARATRRVLLRR